MVLNGEGVSDIDLLRSAMRLQPERMIFVAFDLLHLNGEDLRFKPLVERRARLQEIIPMDGGAIQLSQHVKDDGAAFFAQADWLGLEGMVSKKASAPYRSGRTETWLKVKCFEESTYEVAAVLREPGRPNVAYMVTPDAERRYVGGAFITLNEKMRERLWARVNTKAKPLKGIQVKPGTLWLKPGLIGRVRHLKGEQLLRHATLREIGEDSGN